MYPSIHMYSLPIFIGYFFIFPTKDGVASLYFCHISTKSIDLFQICYDFMYSFLIKLKHHPFSNLVVKFLVHDEILSGLKTFNKQQRLDLQPSWEILLRVWGSHMHKKCMYLGELKCAETKKERKKISALGRRPAFEFHFLSLDKLKKKSTSLIF